ncbi:MAG: SpvB/TcaC N-terminal domain-containing protein [Candidatus Aminicenantes bacterium]|jgi:RHS repeat-associated protein
MREENKNQIDNNSQENSKNSISALTKENASKSNAIRIPEISLPKGGGAIRGIGEKFAANPVTGTGSMSVPIAISPGRSGFGPQLSLSYDSGAGNGPFGFGWNLSLPAITRKTEKGLPKYQDEDESDTFILSGAEDLVPVLKKQGNDWVPENLPDRTIGDNTYRIKRYRPRIEGLFARIERWTNTQTNEIHWRSISRDNIITVYGRKTESRIEDPEASDGFPRVFSWLICESYDDKGNAIYYEYVPENSAGIDHSQTNDRNRTDKSRSANRYLKRIKYGNKTPVQPDSDLPREFREDLSERADWLFEVVFDYEEGHYEEIPATPGDHQFVNARINPIHDWKRRQDPFSSYRSGFEVRTYRLCHRVLMFHHFPDELGVDDYLVRSTGFNYKEGPIASFITSVSQSGFKRQDDGTYLKKSLPPLEFQYSEVTIQDEIQEIDEESLENLPQGLDGAQYQWADIDGEGLSGILTEQGDAWFYKRNVSALPVIGEDGEPQVVARFAPTERLTTIPSFNNLSQGRQQLLDLAGDGQLDVVELDSPTPGFYERTEDREWHTFNPFESLPNISWQDPNLKFVDLTGDGHADIFITEDEVFTWYPSLAEAGFASGEKVRQALDEEKGPRLVFADGTQSVYLADFSGDGLTDLVRIRSGEVCYWPNLGYGRFGAKVTMDNSPHLDAPDHFDQRRIRLADIDGSGVTDIIYLKDDGVYIYLNESGNRWADPEKLKSFPKIDNLSSVVVMDLLGNGTACLVWSSPLPAHVRKPMRYIDLMGGQKPHLLIKTRNNLGAETYIQYAPSTRFYLQDRRSGKPWITRLSFPVHVVEKVTVKDTWRKTSFTTTYSYHHGYFDGNEREFRGFGRVEQTDVESFGTFAAGNTESPYITDDLTFYQPPVKTVTWFHTGAFIDREHILSQYENEYFPNWYEQLIPGETNVLGPFREDDLPEPDIDPGELSAEEWRQALRACKGMMLRQEVYELDVDALEHGEERPVKLFSTAFHNCRIHMLQPQDENPHAVFLATESEAITYHYELDLQVDTLTPDPRIAHTLNLKIDQYGNVLQSAAVVYPRIGKDETLSDDAEGLIAQVQGERHIVYTENRYTNDVDDPANPDQYRLRVPCEVLTYELTGINPEDEGDRRTPDPRDNLYFTLDELRRFRLSDVHQTEGLPVEDILYHQVPSRRDPQKRILEHVRMLFFHENLTDPLPLGQLNSLGLPYETYKLALTNELLSSVFGDKMTPDAHADLNNAALSGYLSGADLDSRFPGRENTGQYWIRSGIAGFAPDAANHFFLPERYIDPFDNETTIAYDGHYDLFVRSSSDPVGNTITVTQFDYRVLAPREIQDINDNLSEVEFDVLGLPTAMAIKGKGTGTEGDSLVFADDVIDPVLTARSTFFTTGFSAAEARRFIGNATARHIYYFGETVAADGTISYGAHAPCAAAILREQHVAALEPGQESPLQVSFEYSDGGGNMWVKKIQAEPETSGGPLRWIANGKTILNNKGKPVKQYEPYFTDSHTFAEPVEVGVTPVMFYDAVGRLIRTELPDHSFSRVEFSPWHVAAFDPNDTSKDSQWYTDRTPTDPERPLPFDPTTGEITVTEDQRAAWLTSLHHDTPAVTILDSLGREVIAIAHNRVQNSAGAHVHGGLRYEDEKYLTFTKLDAEGKPLWIRDARGNLVMQYITPPVPNNQATDPTSGFVPCYDIAGNLLFQHSMDSGDRWMINDAAGQPFYAWDVNERVMEDGSLEPEYRRFHTIYDALRRPVEQRLSLDKGLSWQVVEKFEYRNPATGSPLPDMDAVSLNLGGQIHRYYDPSGLITNQRFDFKGNLLEVQRQMANAYQEAVIDWTEGSPTSGLEEPYTQRTEYDALNRMTRLYNWHRGEGSRVAVYEPQYNQRGLLQKEELVVGATKTATGYIETRLGPERRSAERTEAIRNIQYNVKGQRERIDYGNDTTTTYRYDPETFRLINLTTTRTAGSPVFQDLHYTYDPVGNITAIRDDAQQTVYFRNTRIDPHCRYIYDALYRLIRAEGREHAVQNNLQRDNTPFETITHIPFRNSPEALQRYVEKYQYDSVGNILSMAHHGGSVLRWKRCYQYAEDSNRLLATGRPVDLPNPSDPCSPHYVTAPTLSQRYDYDTHGSMLNLIRTPKEYRLRWDYRDMIHHVNMGGGGHSWYNYDTGKQRTRKVITNRDGDKQWERLYLNGMEVYHRYDASGVVEEIETFHLFADDQRVLIVEDVLQTDDTGLGTGTIYRYQYGNHLGSVALELNEGADPISYEEYHPYGTTAYKANNAAIRTKAKRYRYTGMERDEETGLSYHTARYYAPWLGRWTAGDPSGLEDGNNLYAYADNSTTKANDTTGEWVWVAVAVAAVVVGVGYSILANPSPAGDVENTPDARAERRRQERDAWHGTVRDAAIAGSLPGLGRAAASTISREGVRQGTRIVAGQVAGGMAVGTAVVTTADAIDETGTAGTVATVALAAGGLPEIVRGRGRGRGRTHRPRSGTRQRHSRRTRRPQSAETPPSETTETPQTEVPAEAVTANPDTYLPERATEIHDALIEELGLTGRAADRLTVGVSRPNLESGEVVDIIHVTTQEAYDAIDSGRITLKPWEKLGSPRATVDGFNLHVEIMGVLDAANLPGANGGLTGTSRPACDDCGGRFFNELLPGWRHVNPNPSNDYANTPSDWYTDDQFADLLNNLIGSKK